MKKLTSKMTLIFGSVMLSAALLGGCASTSTQESTGQYLDSSGITTQVKAKFLGDSNIKSLPITVNTYKNNVQLSGFVESQAQKDRAAALARSVQGVASVDNDLIVRPKKTN